jgi:hypothetical protein
MSSLKDKIAAQRKHLADQKAAYVRAYKWKQGKNYVRVLPGLTDPDDFAVEYGAHYIKDPRDSSKLLAVVGDAEICYGQPDPVRQAITDYIHQANERGDENGAKAAKDWLAARKYLVNLAYLDGPDVENKGKVVVAEFSSNQYDTILSLMAEYLDVGRDPFDPVNGLVICVERTGSGMNDTKYTFNTFPAPEQRPLPSNALEARTDLVAYRDSKFGTSVTKAMTVLSSLLGYDVTTTALGSAMASNAQLAAPAAATTTAPAPAPVEAGVGDAVQVNDLDAIMDASFEEVTPVTEPTPVAQTAPAPSPAPAAASADDLDAIMADLENI